MVDYDKLPRPPDCADCNHIAWHPKHDTSPHVDPERNTIVYRCNECGRFWLHDDGKFEEYK